MALARLGVELLLLCCYWTTVAADDDCAVSGNDFCTCSTVNLTLDIRNMGLSYPATTNDPENKYDFIYTPCDLKVCGTSQEEPSAVCQVLKDRDAAFSLGRYTNFKWTVTQYNPLEFSIQYQGGDKSDDDNRNTVVTFKSGEGSTKFTYDRENEKTLTYYFNVVGSKVAPNSGGGGSKGSGGTIAGPVGLALIFLALGALIAYFVVGGIFMYTQRGARGVEVIPNYAFWKDLPFLIKDGFLFVISPCYKGSGKYQGL